MGKQIVLFCVLALLAGGINGLPCTVFLAEDGKRVLAGNNEDWSDPEGVIWFEPAAEGRYGALYVGFGDGNPQGGMNDQGLMFDGLATSPQPQMRAEGKPVFRENIALKALRECATVEEVLILFDRYQVPGLDNAMLFFGDRSGDAVIVEGDDVIRKGADERYLLVTNFYRSMVKPEDIPEGRYRIADRMLSGVKVVDLEACRDVLGAVHQEGDYPTQYSTVYDLKQGLVHVYHFHNFTRPVELDLARELERGEHTLRIHELFPPTFAYKRFVDTRVPPISSVLLATLQEKGFEAALRQYDDLKQHHPEEYDFSEPQLNILGYMLLGGGYVDQAIRIFTLNAGAYPESWNVWDSLGEAWLKKGDREEAEKHYRKSLELNPGNAGAVRALESLAAGPAQPGLE